jgi:hypothetical protein
MMPASKKSYIDVQYFKAPFLPLSVLHVYKLSYMYSLPMQVEGGGVELDYEENGEI